MKGLRSMQREGQEGARSFYSDVMGFVHAVDWTERWLLGLAALHVITWSALILSRRSNDLQMVLLLVIRAYHALAALNQPTQRHL